MRATGMEIELQKRRIVLFRDPGACGRWSSLRACSSRHETPPSSSGPRCGGRWEHRSWCGRRLRDTRNDRKILFLHRAIGKIVSAEPDAPRASLPRSRQPVVSLSRRCTEHSALGERNLALLEENAAQKCSYRRRVFRNAGCRMDGDACGFIDDETGFIFVENFS